MSNKSEMRDIIVFLPGITGSVLQKDGKDLWAISGQAAWDFVTSMGNLIQNLKLEGDDHTIDDLGDGIKATSLIQDTHFIPGLTKIDGYTVIAHRIQDEFDVTPGENYFEFPYDWRRDNRVAARQLEKFINQRLPQWRDASGAKNAKVILIAHSMGGLVSRYYLEVLGGWQNCRALITFGTPYRGSINALNYLANGYKKLFLDLTDVMRSFTSVYQLLPIYEMLQVGDKYQRVAETDNIPNLLRNKAEDALKFHREIEATQQINAQNEHYKNSFCIVPYVGTEQKTYQSAQLLDEKLKICWEVPPRVGNELDSGDGTVPRVSATPIEFDFDSNSKLRLYSRFIAEKHGSLQNNGSILLDLLKNLQNLQLPEKEPVRGVLSQTAISLELDDLYLKTELVTIKAEIKGRFPQIVKDNLALEANIEPVSNRSNSGTKRRAEFQKIGNEWLISINDLEPGLYRLEVKTVQSGGGFPNAVHDLFEICQ
ncbi:lecithin--cholesterol acyltransferase [Nostoc sp. RF31YmG]|nr:lecithin--cholesterol acyltransferase [Nostoc sp. RF31YmG]